MKKENKMLVIRIPLHIGHSAGAERENGSACVSHQLQGMLHKIHATRICPKEHNILKVHAVNVLFELISRTFFK